jgi:hypothetical protein
MSVHDNEFCGNTLLAAMPEEDQVWLKERVVSVQRPAGTILHEAGAPVTHTYFPCDRTLASFSVSAEAAGRVEAALIGCEGAVGGVVTPGDLPAYSRAEVQFGGAFLMIPVSDLRALEERSPVVQRVMAIYGDCLLAQVLQTAACNAVHAIEQRAAKWLLAAAGRTGSDTLPITQERLADMLGVGRSFVNRVLGGFRAAGLVDSRRGALIVVDTAGLQALACERCVSG